MRNTVQNIEELYTFLFAMRFHFQDLQYNENRIIREFKIYINNTDIIDFEGNLQINNIVYGFYQYYNIDIPFEDIQNVSIINNNIISTLLNLNNQYTRNEINDQSDENSDNQPDENSDNQPDENNINIVGLFSSIHITSSTNQINITHNSMFNAINTLLSNLTDYDNINTDNVFEDVLVTIDDNELSKLNTNKLESCLDMDCSICINQMQKNEYVTELKCSHKFHTDCIKKYLTEYSYKCPICRTEVGKVKYNI